MFDGMFEGFDVLLDTLKKDSADKDMKFREQSNYRKRFDYFSEAIRAYYEAKEKGDTTDGLECLMLEAYQFMKFIRREWRPGATLPPQYAIPRPVETALSEVASILDEPLEYCVPMQREADALEVLSFSIFTALKKNGDIKYCKHCKKFLDAPCKRHKEPSSVDELFYCKGCGGYLTTPCECHVAVEQPRLKRTL